MIKLLKKFGYLPRLAVWELTLKCNLNCRHCGSRAGRKRADELTTPEALKLCKDLAELKCRHLTLSGGEPLLRKDWPLICSTLVDLGVKTNMVTNGKSWNKDTTKTALAVGLESAAFSIDGLEETHTYIRREPGHWKHVWSCIDHCKQMGLTASVITVVHRKNLHELDELRQLLIDHGVDRWQVQLANPTGNMADHRDLCLEPEDVLVVVPKLAELCAKKSRPKVYPAHNVGYYGEPEEHLRDTGGAIPFWVGCTAGCSVIGIESNGGIKGCLSLPSAMNGEDRFLEGNIRDTPLREIWYRRGAFSYNRDFTTEQLSGYCAECDYAEICRGGCSWTAFAYTGSRFENLYCYWRQLKEKEKREAASRKESSSNDNQPSTPADSPKRRIPVVQG
ncbi:MAG TPA: radical SAM protein [Polyangiaceae bacterium]|jgi:radical SAM protein with 4Fe4S-binding SPASM domain|nr:MAG: Cyclic pyranopterin monophosphate synthase [Deltaproteobacteria bacterium ADurb.Bin207]HNS99088.1 radical SAM protein [Polyangiaceae bacterium]HNZ25202.1 radical SAM protein [Polyangiaceae bacterium]HOD25354.1 radical SAM protein [Polyangiaceae bacterium]HOE51581.1 radical SAM protein [Polyangiaceae bacterium]